MRIYRTEELLERKVNRTGKTKSQLLAELKDVLDCGRNTLYRIRFSTNEKPFSASLPMLYVMKEFFEVSTVDELLNPSEVREVINRSSK